MLRLAGKTLPFVNNGMDRLAPRTLLVQLVLLLCAQDFHMRTATAQVSCRPDLTAVSTCRADLNALVNLATCVHLNLVTVICLPWTAASSTALQQRHAVRSRAPHSRLYQCEARPSLTQDSDTRCRYLSWLSKGIMHLTGLQCSQHIWLHTVS